MGFEHLVMHVVAHNRNQILAGAAGVGSAVLHSSVVAAAIAAAPVVIPAAVVGAAGGYALVKIWEHIKDA